MLKKISFPHYFAFVIAWFPMLSTLGIPLDSYFIRLIWGYFTVIYILWYKHKRFNPQNIKDFTIIDFFLYWSLISIIRGIFIADNYWEYKNLSNAILCLMLPSFCYIFENANILHKTLRLWFKYLFPFFIITLVWQLRPESYNVYISPIYIIGCLIPILPRKWQIISLVFILLMISDGISSRAQMLKALMVLLIAIGLYFRRYIPLYAIKITYIIIICAPIILLICGFTGIFNVFQDNENIKGKYTQQRMSNGTTETIDMAADTRTFIYREVVTSAVKHNYVLWGRSPARGNDSLSFGAYNAENLKTGKYERFMNEVGHLNVFTWVGLVGLILWSSIFIKSSYLAIYKSNNIFIKYIGLFIAFRFLMGWIEDVNNFNFQSISIWMLIAMGFSQRIRTMNNIKFKYWILTCIIPLKNRPK